MEWTDRLRGLVEHLEFGLVQSGRWGADYYLADGVVFCRLTEAEWRAVLRECRLEPRLGRAVGGEWSDILVDPVEVSPPPDARLIAAAVTTLGVITTDGWCQLIETVDGRLWPFDPRFWPWWTDGALSLYEGPRGPMLVVRRDDVDRDYLMGLRLTQWTEGSVTWGTLPGCTRVPPERPLVYGRLRTEGP